MSVSGRSIVCAGLLAASLFASASGTRAQEEGLPGAKARSEELQRRLTAAVAARGPDYRARTRHLREDGSPRYVNRLILETSPYLQQHAHNPVNWYPWGDEAFRAARDSGRPVLLSIGYSTCHWCHVMEEESFEDEEIAAFLNEHYVAIKVDREERPDLDEIYMSAVQLLAGRGGWPMTTWLTPDRQPFFGGTYFPPRDGNRGARKGFLTLLRELRDYYDEAPERAAARAAELSSRIRATMVPPAGDRLPGTGEVDAAVGACRDQFDPVAGGLRGAPKFPSSLPLRLLMRRSARDGEAVWTEMAATTLERMAAGGIHDQIGGGFHRYSTDARWLVPHFEKMLYDNALLTLAYLEGYQATQREEFAGVARRTLDYVAREMTSPTGGFYSATDADSLDPAGERTEGWFFTWTPAEVRAVLGADEATIVEAYFNVTERGNLDGRSILHVTRPLEEVAKRFNLEPSELTSRLESARSKLYRARLLRPAPLLDDKILAAWNGLMISAFARAGFVLADDAYLEQAGRAADFVLSSMRKEGRLRRSYKDGRTVQAAFLDDYAFVIAGLLDLFEATWQVRWLDEAIALQGTLDEHYADRKAGGYFMTGADHETLLVRAKPTYDGAEPSGNSIALMNLLRLHELTTEDRYRLSADRLMRAFGDQLARRPRALSEMLLAVEFAASAPREIAIVAKGGRADAAQFVDVLRESYRPNVVLAVFTEGAELEQVGRRIAWAKGKRARDGKPTAYVCQEGICGRPTTDAGEFARQLADARPEVQPGVGTDPGGAAPGGDP